MEQEIFTLAAALGRVGEPEEERLRLLCRSARTELEGRLRDGVAAVDCAVFPMAAAWTALADLCDGGRLDGVASFTAGALTVRTGERADGERLRRRALALLGPWLRDEGFCFQGVRG